MRAVRIALAQLNVTVGDLVANLEAITRWIERAKELGVDIVTFPELALCGYPPEDLLLEYGFLYDNRRVLELLLPRCKGITVVVGFADAVGRKVYNAAALIHDGELVDVYHKIELPNYGVFDEKRYFEPGDHCVIFDLGDARFCLTICEDIWIPRSITENFPADNHADAVLNLSASPFHAGKMALRRETVTRYAGVTNTTVFYNNLIGGQDELIFDGGSLVENPRGQVIARAPSFEEALLVTDFVPDRTPEKDRPTQLIGKGKRVHVLGPLSPSVRPEIRVYVAPEPDRVEEIYKALVLGTRDYVVKNGFQKVVIGLSGGIDSSLTAAIAVEALGADNVVGVTMPSPYTSGETFSDAALLAQNLNVELITVPVRDIFLSYLNELKDPLGEGPQGVAEENLQARIRGNILMALSNRFGWLVLTTGNKSETAVGYCTLYGDMAGGFGVIKDVPKTVVYELSEYVNMKARRDLIPRSVIRRPPTAELRPDQKDEDSLPPYGTLDPILRAYVEDHKAPHEIEAAGFARRTVDEVVCMVDRNEYKRRQAPPGVKITPRAFGRDRRLPITNRYRCEQNKEGLP